MPLWMGALAILPLADARLILDPPSSGFVGQAIACQIQASGGDAAAIAVDWPRLAWADLIPINGGRAWIVPRRAGTFLLPAFRVRSGESEARAGPARLSIRPVPAAGRGPDFLGGVGTLRISRQVDRAAIRVGQELSCQITLEGPGALGTRIPASGWGWLPDEHAAERLDVAETLAADVPRRSIRFRIRPTQPGTLRFPPLTVSTYLPESGRFEIAHAPAVAIEVAIPPLFDVDAALARPPNRSGRSSWVAPALGALGLLVALLSLLAARQPRRKRNPAQSRSAAIRDARDWLATCSNDDQLPRGITHRVGLILRACGQPVPAWSTPDEAAARLGEHSEPAEATRSLLRACEIALFAPSGVDRDSGERLRAAFADWLDRVASSHPLSSN